MDFFEPHCDMNLTSDDQASLKYKISFKNAAQENRETILIALAVIWT